MAHLLRYQLWSSKPGGDIDFRVSILNEVGELRSRCVVSENQARVYLHVDDTVVVTAEQSKLHADDLMVAFAESMEEVGFSVPERRTSERKSLRWSVSKRINVELLFKFPAKKAWLLRNTLKYMARQSHVDVDLLRAVVGIYMHGAQLNRDLMTIPFVIYRRIERCEGEVVRMWPSVRRELQAMSSAVIFMQCQVSRTFSDVVWASDAQGAGEGDLGGFGVVCAKVSESELRALRESGESLGRSVARLDGTLSGVKIHTNLSYPPCHTLSSLSSFRTMTSRHACKLYQWYDLSSKRYDEWLLLYTDGSGNQDGAMLKLVDGLSMITLL